MNEKHQLASLQLAIMQVLWDQGEATVGEVRDALKHERPLAYTTVATMLTKLERNGRVKHRTKGRVHIYRPTINQENVRRTMVSDLADRLFQGDLTEMVSQLLDGCEVTAEELSRLKKVIRQKEQEAKNA